MENNLGLDGPLERYSRGLDTWVPLDSEASFAAMKRSIDIQRKSGDKHSARVLLRIKAPKQALERVNEKLQPGPPAPVDKVTQPPHVAAITPITGSVNGRIKAPPMSNGSSGPMIFRPFAPPHPPPAVLPLDRTSNFETANVNPAASVPLTATPIPAPLLAPPHPLPPQPTMPPPQPSVFDPMAPQPFPEWIFPPPPPPPPAPAVAATSLPPFPFGPSSSNGDGSYPMWNMEQRRLPPITSQFPPPNPNGAPGAALLPPPPLPLPPLVPDRLHPIMPRPNATTTVDRLSISTDASEVLDMLGDLGDKVVQMGYKVDQMQVEEKKHYESLRRGLKRLKDKEDKPDSRESPEITVARRGMEDLSLRTRESVGQESAGPNENGESPYCICNYCIQRKNLLSSTLMRRQCGHVCYVRYLRGFYHVR